MPRDLLASCDESAILLHLPKISVLSVDVEKKKNCLRGNNLLSNDLTSFLFFPPPNRSIFVSVKTKKGNVLAS